MQNAANLAQAGTSQLIDVVDHASNAVVVAVEETHDSLNATAQSALVIEGKTFDVAMGEVKNLRAQYIQSLRNVVEAVTGAATGNG